MDATTEPKNVLKKTIPKKTMGFLKFAYWALNAEGTIAEKFKLNEPIENICKHVKDIVEHGEQDVVINQMRKQLIAKPRSTKRTYPQIVNEIVELARSDMDITVEEEVGQIINNNVGEQSQEEVRIADTTTKVPKKRARKEQPKTETTDTVVTTNDATVTPTKAAVVINTPKKPRKANKPVSEVITPIPFNLIS